MYEVCIYTKDIFYNPNYDGYAISLPASKAEIEDALQRARVCGENNYVLEFLFWPEFLIPFLEDCEPTIEEANVLATGIFTFDESNLYKYEAVIRFLPELTMRSLINAAFSLERFEFYAGIHSEEELGAFAIDMDILPVLESLPEEIYDLLSEKKVGTYMVEQENGVFTEEGYCFRFEEGWDDVYEEKIQNFKEESNCPILICLEVGEKDGYREAWIGLPCREESIRESREYLSAEIGGECRFEKVQSVIPQLEKMRFGFQDIEKLNLLAQSLLEEEGKNIWKYKALLETKAPASVEELIELFDSLDSYEMDVLLPFSYQNFGKRCLKDSGVELSKEEAAFFDYEGYGRSEGEKRKLSYSSYGMIYPVASAEIQLVQENREGMQGMA